MAGSLADRSQDIAGTLAQARVAIQQAGDAAQQIGQLAGTTNKHLDPILDNLNSAVASAKHSMANLDEAVNDAKPGLKALSTQTVPQVNQLIRDLGQTADSLQQITRRSAEPEQRQKRLRRRCLVH